MIFIRQVPNIEDPIDLWGQPDVSSLGRLHRHGDDRRGGGGGGCRLGEKPRPGRGLPGCAPPLAAAAGVPDAIPYANNPGNSFLQSMSCTLRFSKKHMSESYVACLSTPSSALLQPLRDFGDAWPAGPSVGAPGRGDCALPPPALLSGPVPESPSNRGSQVQPSLGSLFGRHLSRRREDTVTQYE